MLLIWRTLWLERIIRANLSFSSRLICARLFNNSSNFFDESHTPCEFFRLCPNYERFNTRAIWNWFWLRVQVCLSTSARNLSTGLSKVYSYCLVLSRNQRCNRWYVYSSIFYLPHLDLMANFYGSEQLKELLASPMEGLLFKSRKFFLELNIWILCIFSMFTAPFRKSASLGAFINPNVTLG